MRLTRRDLLATGALAPVGFSLLPLGAGAGSGSAGTGQVIGVQRLNAGRSTVTALLDGHLALGAEMFSNLTAEEASELLETAFVETGPVPTGVNAYVVDTDGELTLIDAGGRGAFEPLGALDKALEAAGIDKTAIGRVLVTHLHPDHIGGLAKDGAPDYPEATLHVHAEDVAFWTSEENRQNAGDRVAFFELAQQTLDAYGDRVETFEQDGTVGGFQAMHLPGHTPGHTGYRIGEGDDSLLVWGDIVHVAAFQFAKPEASIGFDVNPEQAIETRRNLFAKAARERQKIAGMHLAFPGVGHVVDHGDQGGFVFVPAPWDFEVN